MSDWFRNDQEQDYTPEAPAPMKEPSPAVEPYAPPVVPPMAEEPAPAVEPYAPPVVPPMAEEPAPAVDPAPTVEPYTPPVTPPAPPSYPQAPYYTGASYQSPYQPYTPPVPVPPPMPEKPKKPAKTPEQKRRAMEHWLIAALALVCVVSVTVSVILGVSILNSKGNGSDDTANNSSSAVTTEDEDIENRPSLQITDLQEIDDGGLPAREIVEKNLDATVVLTMYHKNSTINSYNDYFGGYFGGYFDYYGSYGEDDENLTQASAASGIIMSEDGYIITNSHCVFDEDYLVEFARIDVTLYDGTVYEGAKIVGYDRSTDLAVIKVDATGLKAAEFGDSSALSLGDRVLTLGNSGGLSWSVSQGILSGQARDVYEESGYAIKCLQVDAIINPGSSGGPLINAYGQVVGVNSAKIVLTGYEGLGFSIPINEAKAIIDDLIKYGYATGRVSLGIMGQTVTSIGYEGFIIEEINDGSALEGTKAKVGDIITHVNGVRVMNYEEMRTELTKNKVGDTISISLIRLDRQTRKVTEFTVKVKLGEMK